jgi:hypothetical protein
MAATFILYCIFTRIQNSKFGVKFLLEIFEITSDVFNLSLAVKEFQSVCNEIQDII